MFSVLMSLYSLVPVKANASFVLDNGYTVFWSVFYQSSRKNNNNSNNYNSNVNNNTLCSHRSLEYNEGANTQFLRYWKLFA